MTGVRTKMRCYYYISHVSYNTTTTIQIGYSSTTNATSSFTWGTQQTVSSGSSLDDYYEEIPTGTKYTCLKATYIVTCKTAITTLIHLSCTGPVVYLKIKIPHLVIV